MCVIYKYTSPEGKSYIGQTTKTPARRASSNGHNYRRSRYFYDAIKKFGFNSLKLEILEECQEDELDDRERYWIAYYNTVYHYQVCACAGKQRLKRVKNTIFTYEPFVDWNHYTLKHKRSSTTIPEGSNLKRDEVLCPAEAEEDIVSFYEKS